MMETAVGSSRMVFQSGSRTTSNSRGGRGSWGMAAKVAPPPGAGKEVDGVRHNSATVETLPSRRQVRGRRGKAAWFLRGPCDLRESHSVSAPDACTIGCGNRYRLYVRGAGAGCFIASGGSP